MSTQNKQQGFTAADMAAAPVDGSWDAQAYSQMADELESWKQRALTAEGDFNRLHEALNAESGPMFMGEPVLRAPAAPGIDMGVRGATLTIDGKTFTVDEVRAALLIDASPKGGSNAPDMFWNDADPERAFDSIIELVSQGWSNGSVVEGDVMEIQQAIRLPNIKVRVVESEDDGVDYEQLQATSAEVGS